MAERGWLWGSHAVEEALRAGGRKALELLLLREGGGERRGELARLAAAQGARVRLCGREELDRIAGGAEHQGVALLAGRRPAGGLAAFLDSLAGADRGRLALVALDQIQDPHNLGAIARSAACLGAAGLLVPSHGAAPVTQAAVRASAGAIERIPVVDAGNMAAALGRLKALGFWVYGADMAGRPAWDTTFNAPLVLVIGSEGRGIRPLVRRACDEAVSVPQSAAGVASLNASCAASVLLYEVFRQLRA